MRSFKSNIPLLGLALAARCASGCSTDPCFPNSNGKEYRVTVGEIWDLSSQFPGGSEPTTKCPSDLDLIAGGSFDIKITGFNGDAPSCACGEGTITRAPDNWQWKQASDVSCNDNFFEAHLEAKQGDCSGVVFLSIRANNVPTGKEVPGKRPVAYVDRIFQSGLSCAGRGATCSSLIVAEIEEL